MSFSSSLFTRRASGAVARRAIGYKNRVYIKKQQPGLIEADVFGTRRYTTGITHIGKEYQDACTCPYGVTCKHTIALAHVIADNPQLVALIDQPGADKNIRNTPAPKTFLDILGDIIAPPPPQFASSGRKKDQRAYYVLFTRKKPDWSEDKGKTLLGFEAGKAERNHETLSYRLNQAQNIRSMLGRNPAYFTAIDRAILRIAANTLSDFSDYDHWNAVPVEDDSAHELIRRLAPAPLLFFDDGKKKQPLTIAAEPLGLKFRLEESSDGWKPVPAALAASTIYSYDPPIAVTADRKLYVLDTAMSARQITELISAPPIPTEVMYRPQTIAALLEVGRTVPIIFPSQWETTAVPGVPTPIVTIRVNTRPWTVSLAFSYDDARIAPDDSSMLFARRQPDHPIGRRDLAKEQNAIILLSQALRLPADPQFPWIIPPQAEPALFADIVPGLPDDWEFYLQKETALALSSRPLSFSFETESTTDWLDINSSVSINDQTVALHELLDRALTADPVIRINGRYHILPPPLRQALEALRPIKNMSPDGALRLHRTQIGLLDDLSGIINRDTLHTQWKRTIAAIKNFDGIKDAPIPGHLNGALRPYQRDGVAFLACHHELGFGAILADDMGLGKTIQAVALLAIIHKKAGKSSLIVCPTSVIDTWQTELSRFAPGLRLAVYSGTGRALPKPKQTDVIITSYPLLWRDRAILQKSSWRCVILDESQYIKNHQSQTAKAACGLTADHRLCLTGTPMENNTRELFSQFAFLNPGLFANAEQFKQQFAVPIERDNDAAARQRLRKLIAPFLLRRTKSQVLTDLPPKIEQTRILAMDQAQRTLYDTVKAHYQAKVLRLVEEQGLAKSHIRILEALLRLRQVCCDPRLLHFKQRAPWLPARLHTNQSVKRIEAIGLLKQAVTEGHSVLLFSQFVQMLDLLAQDCRREEIPMMILTGQTKNRGRLVRKFQTNGTAAVFLISLKAGGTGLTLTAADYVIHYDPWWNPAVEVQATDRTHRIGQTKSVNVYKLIVKDTIEEKIQALQEKKKGLIDDLITAPSGPKRLTPQDLAFLFS